MATPALLPPLPAAARTTVHATRHAAADRLDWVDVAKGLGIVLVVAGHALVGLMAAGMAPREGWMGWAHAAIYSFHMPLFFLLSGLFVQRQLSRAPLDFAQWLLQRLAWPYLLWSALQLALIAQAGSSVNVPTPWSSWRLVELLWQPVSQYWFLHALMLFHLLARVSQAVRGLWWPLACVLAYAMPGLGPALDMGVDPAAGLHLSFLPWYALGAQLGSAGLCRLAQLLREARAVPMLGLAAAATGAAGMVALHRQGLDRYGVAAVGTQLAGVVAALCLCLQLGGRWRGALAWIGRRSMAIFLMHVMVVAGLRIVLVRLWPTVSADLVFGLALVLGTLLPCVAQALLQRVGLATWAGLDGAARAGRAS